MSTPPLEFDGLEVGGGSFSVSLPANTCMSIIGDEASGVDSIGARALGIQDGNGRAVVMGTDITQLSRFDALAFRRRVGYLPAGDGLLQNLSLRENVALPLRFGSNFSEREIEGRLGILLASVNLSHVATLRPAQVGDEQRRRTALVRALAFDPKLVIMEQPFDGLTNNAAREVIDLARGGDTAEGSRRTVMVVGHSLPEAVHPRFELRYRLTRNGLARLN
jgi:ABC-type transporter Mla maintaining outer membrane lipid asymmetry ATPase subunit MlaF